MNWWDACQVMEWKLGRHRVRFVLRPVLINQVVYWQVLKWIGYDGRWDTEPGYFAQMFPDRRKAKRMVHRNLRALRATASYY